MGKKFRIVVDDSKGFFKFLNEFNTPNRTDFKIVETYFSDGVEFVNVEYTSASLESIFNLGYSFAGFRIRNGEQ